MSQVAKIDGVAIASIAKIDGIVKASISKIDGILVSADAWMSPTAIHSKCGEEAAAPASNTIDGNTSTQWAHASTHEHWIIFDLGSTKSVKKIRVHGGGLTRYYLCGVSAIYINDTADESGGSKGSGNFSTSGWHEIDVTDTSGRYIKLKLRTYTSLVVCTNTSALNRFYEFEAYGS